jgi:hypothetical protein
METRVTTSCRTAGSRCRPGTGGDPLRSGVPGQHQPPGPGNLVYRCDATRVYPDPKRNRREAVLPDRVYRIRDHFDKAEPLVADFAPAPKAGTLVPVPGRLIRKLENERIGAGRFHAIVVLSSSDLHGVGLAWSDGVSARQSARRRR